MPPSSSPQSPSGNNADPVASSSAIPKSMVDALDSEDPYQALLSLSHQSQTKALHLSQQLDKELENFATIELPDLLQRLPDLKDVDSHPVSTAIACSDSILNSLTKIASGGSQASQEIRLLEKEKRELEEHAQDVETALVLRKASDMAAQSLSASRYEVAAKAIQEFLLQTSKLTDRAKAYAGEYTVTQLELTHAALQTTLLEQYQEAVKKSDIMSLGKLTPLVQMIQMEQEAVALYVRYLKGVLTKDLKEATNASSLEESKTNNKPTSPYLKMGRVYNSAVTTLRHHLPMVSHCLHRADGDAAVVQLIHAQVEQTVCPLFQDYIQSRQLAVSSHNAQSVYEALEDRYRSAVMDEDVLDDDCGFATKVGSLADVDSAMEEAALCLQHTESYTRFIRHTVREVNKARALRHTQEQRQQRMERERKEWATGMSSKPEQFQDAEKDYVPLEILPAYTPLQEVVAEVGGYYSVIERCLLLASMQRSFSSMVEEDMRFYTPLGLPTTSSTNRRAGQKAIQSSIVESCLYAARRGTQRAFATGHTGTASAVANFCSDCLRGVLVEHLSRRAEDIGVKSLKPGEGLLTGSGGILDASNILRQGQTLSSAVGGVKQKDKVEKQREIEQGIAFACATLNDLVVAAHHTQELENVLLHAVDKGYPPNDHETEQLRMCVKGLSPVAEVFQLSATNAIESLISVMKPRIRAIVTDAVGDGSGGGFMGGGAVTDRHAVRMNYDLDEEAYQLLEVSEGYISRLCTCLDELILSVCANLAPRLSDALVLEVLGTVSKRLEISLKKVSHWKRRTFETIIPF